MIMNPFGNLKLACGDTRLHLELDGQELLDWQDVLVVTDGPEEAAPRWTLGRIDFGTHSSLTWPQLLRTLDKPRPVSPYDRFAFLPAPAVEFLQLGKTQLQRFKHVATLSAQGGGEELERAKMELADVERQMVSIYCSGLEIGTIIVDFLDILVRAEKERYVLHASFEFLEPKAGSQRSCFWAHRCRHAFSGTRPSCRWAERGDCDTFRPVERPWPKNEVHPIGSGNYGPGCHFYEEYMAQLASDTAKATALDPRQVDARAPRRRKAPRRERSPTIA
jgi:hypothetical protein